MQNMHKSMYLHILHIYALPTLLMSDFPNPKCSSCAKPEGQTKGCTLWSSFFGSRWLVQRTLKFSVICQYFSATVSSISYLSESQPVWVLSGLVLLVSSQRHWQGRQRFSEHIRNFMKIETWKLKVSAGPCSEKWPEACIRVPSLQSVCFQIITDSSGPTNGLLGCLKYISWIRAHWALSEEESLWNPSQYINSF